MADLKKAAEDLTAAAALGQAKRAAKRAFEDALSTDEERAERAEREAEQKKKKRTKLLVLGAVGLLLVLGVVGMVLTYWQYFFLAGLVGLAALYGRHRWRNRAARKLRPAATASTEVSPSAKLRVPASPARAPSPAPDDSVDDELAALKSRLDK
jgi:Flp pilus assembly protein TadB